MYHFGTCGGRYSAMVMELLGPSLEDLFVLCNRRFNLKTVVMIAIQLVSDVICVHSVYAVYPDGNDDTFTGADVIDFYCFYSSILCFYIHVPKYILIERETSFRISYNSFAVWSRREVHIEIPG